MRLDGQLMLFTKNIKTRFMLHRHFFAALCNRACMARKVVEASTIISKCKEGNFI
jgi:hypothetical protein